MTIKLGQRVEDRVTGFTGIAISKVEYLNGCVQFCVKPRAGNDGKMIEAEYIDVQQLAVVGDGLLNEVVDAGGPVMDNPPTGYAG